MKLERKAKLTMDNFNDLLNNEHSPCIDKNI